jgi:hypothetical protein
MTCPSAECFSTPWYVGVGTVYVKINKYQGDPNVKITLQYKTGATQSDCLLDTWHNAININNVPSLGWIQINIIKNTV